jgi:isoquinoline 1-oxidoreductase alpha subunit
MPTFNLKINGKTHAVEADADTPLLWVLRDKINLVGTKFGCGIGQCGACTVHVDGSAMRSCLLQVSQAEDVDITTIEGLSEHNDHPVQQAWKAIDVPQCGYCQAGQIMTASAFLNENPNPSNEDIRNAMNGNICRCASYNSIEEAVKLASENIS